MTPDHRSAEVTVGLHAGLLVIARADGTAALVRRGDAFEQVRGCVAACMAAAVLSATAGPRQSASVVFDLGVR